MQELKQELQQIFKDANVVKWIGGLKVTGLNEVNKHQIASLITIETKYDEVEDYVIKRSGTGVVIIIDTF